MSTERDLGMEALQRGDGAAAVQHLEQACAESPDDFRAHMYLGGAYGQVNRPTDAVRVLRRAVELQPTSPQAQYNFGVALERSGSAAEAQTAIQKAIALQPDYPQAEAALGRLQAASQPAAAPPAPADAPLRGSPAPPDASGAGLNAPRSAPWAPAPPPAGPLPVSPPPAYPPGSGMARDYGIPTQPQRSSSAVWIVLGAVFGGLLLVMVAAALVFPLLAQLADPLRSTKPGPIVQEPQAGLTCTLPYSFPVPERKGASVPVGPFTITTAQYISRNTSGECTVGVVTMPAVAVSAVPAQQLFDMARQRGLGTANATQTGSREMSYQGFPAQEFRYEAPHEGQTEYGRMRLILASPRLIYIGFSSRRKSSTDAPGANMFFDSLKISR